MEGAVADRKWYAIRTQPRKEELARVQYENQGFEAFLPRVLRYRRHARSIKQVAAPLFPGYLFLFLNEDELRWSAVSSTIGAVGPVRFGDFYPPVPEWVIGGIRDRMDEQGFVSCGYSRKKLPSRGDRVRVKWLCYDALEGIFLARKGKDRALILLDILKGQVRAEVPLQSLKAA